MGLLSSILLAPFTGPVRGALWTMEKVGTVAQQELTDDTPIKEDLMRLQIALDEGEIDEDEYVRQEAVIMDRLREVRAWRERFGMPVTGGPVRVARDE